MKNYINKLKSEKGYIDMDEIMNIIFIVGVVIIVIFIICTIGFFLILISNCRFKPKIKYTFLT